MKYNTIKNYEYIKSHVPKDRIEQFLEEYKQEIKTEVIEEFCEGYKNFQTDENICDLQEDCSFSVGWCIDCFKDKWLKVQKYGQN